MLHLKREYTHIVYLRIRIHEPSLSVTCSLHSKSLVADNTLATRRSIKTHENSGKCNKKTQHHRRQLRTNASNESCCEWIALVYGSYAQIKTQWKAKVHTPKIKLVHGPSWPNRSGQTVWLYYNRNYLSPHQTESYEASQHSTESGGENRECERNAKPR